MGLLNFLTFGLFGRTVEHDHTCHCGMVNAPHKTGEWGCKRIMVTPPDKLEGDRWFVDGAIITGYSLRDQRGYHKHPCGCWSRAIGSENSIEA